MFEFKCICGIIINEYSKGDQMSLSFVNKIDGAIRATTLGKILDSRIARHTIGRVSCLFKATIALPEFLIYLARAFGYRFIPSCLMCNHFKYSRVSFLATKMEVDAAFQRLSYFITNLRDVIVAPKPCKPFLITDIISSVRNLVWPEFTTFTKPSNEDNRDYAIECMKQWRCDIYYRYQYRSIFPRLANESLKQQ